MDVHTLSLPIGAFTGATIHPVVFIPSTMGAITVLDAKVVGIGAGTSIGLALVTGSDLGTPAAVGTVCKWGGTFAAGTIVYAEGVVFDATAVDMTIASGQWLCVDQASGTAPATTVVSVTFAYGY